MLWHTLYMQEALSWKHSYVRETGEEDIARLFPLMLRHINVLGHYKFTLPEDVKNGGSDDIKFIFKQ